MYMHGHFNNNNNNNNIFASVNTHVYECVEGFVFNEKSKIPFSYMLRICLFCKRAYRGTKPEESFG